MAFSTDLLLRFSTKDFKQKLDVEVEPRQSWPQMDCTQGTKEKETPVEDDAGSLVYQPVRFCDMFIDHKTIQCSFCNTKLLIPYHKLGFQNW